MNKDDKIIIEIVDMGNLEKILHYLKNRKKVSQKIPYLCFTVLVY